MRVERAVEEALEAGENTALCLGGGEAGGLEADSILRAAAGGVDGQVHKVAAAAPPAAQQRCGSSRPDGLTAQWLVRLSAAGRVRAFVLVHRHDMRINAVGHVALFLLAVPAVSSTSSKICYHRSHACLRHTAAHALR